MSKKSKLKKCICGNPPINYNTTITVKGCDCSVSVVECVKDWDNDILPFVEHRLTVYGSNPKEAEQRWNEFIKKSRFC